MIILNRPSIRNLRDLGGTETRDGRRIKKRCLLRSAHLGNATDADIRWLQRECRLKTVIDLRTVKEQEELPDYTGECVHLSILIFDELIAGVTHEEAAEQMPFPDMRDLYRMMMLDSRCQMAFRKVLETCFQNDYSKGAVLWHCTEGKDRCGMTAALLLEALGVDRLRILEDYLETNTTGRESKAAL